MTEISHIPGFTVLAEPELLFHCDRFQDKSTHPLRGLLDFGPYSRSQINSVIDPVRVALVTPNGQISRLQSLVKELESSCQPVERKAYLPDYPGFRTIFGVRIIESSVSVELDADIDSLLSRSVKPHLILIGKLIDALTALRNQRNEFDVIMLLLPTKWSNCFFGDGTDDFDLHDFIKATTASWGIPIQLLREDHALSYRCRCSVLWHLGIALYSKAGGIPWKLADSDQETVFIGLGYALKKPGAENRFVTCCSQVFDSDGAGLEFLAYETSEATIEQKNPFLNRNEMRKVMARSLMLFQKRHGGRIPKKIVIHKNNVFKKDEMDGCFDVFGSAESVDLIHVQHNSLWRGVKLDQSREQPNKGVPAKYPCERGAVLQLSGRDVLVWVQGNAPGAAKGKDFFKEGRGIPAPLQLTRFAGHGSLNDSCSAVLALSKMDWNNDSFYDRLPVTISFANELANIAKRMTTVGSKPYEFRFFM
jgi:hypothetical protein